MHGTWTAFHENGKKERQGSMIEGKEDGKWKLWNLNGELEMTVVYKMGEKSNLNLH